VAVKRIKPLLRLAALASSLLLAAGCVSYRAGVFDWLNPKESETAPSKTNGDAAQASDGKEPVAIPSTKFARFISGPEVEGTIAQPPAATQAAPPAMEKEPAMIGGTKSFFNTFPEVKKWAQPAPKEAQPPAPTKPSADPK
jgi:hypothetical protein